MQLLSIGNSFSQDAHKWLHKLAQNQGIYLETVNLYIPGCSLEMHYNNLKNDLSVYDFEPNGNGGERKISIIEALKLRPWDTITLQQVSGLSGMYETYEPYLSELVSVIKKVCPDATLYFHQTWAYETDSEHPDFVKYNRDQTKMYRCIEKASKTAAQSIGAREILAGKTIQTLRETLPEFDYKNGGKSLCRDGFHLSLDYGRFSVAATWLKTLTGQEIQPLPLEDFDPELVRKILKIVNEI